MSQAREKALVQYEFDATSEEIDRQFARMEKIGAKQRWREFFYLLAIGCIALFVVRHELGQDLQQKDMRGAFDLLVLLIIILFIYLEAARWQQVKQMKAIIDMLKQQKGGK